MKRKNVFLGHIVVMLGFLLVGLSAATQYTAHALGHQSQLGAPMSTLAGHPVYEPWAWFWWAYRYEPYAPRVFSMASTLTYAGFGAGVVAAVALAIFRMKRATTSTAYGSARWATTPELARAGLLIDEGVILSQTSEARYSSAPDGKGDVRWKMNRPGKLLRHAGPEHVFCFAPTRSGKGVGLVIPTLLSWTQSVLVYDIKKELWAATAGWRRKFSQCWRFEPSAPDSVRFNPLMEIRKGPNEIRDAQNIADILIDPEGTSEKRNHWQLTGHTLLVGAILHVLYAEEDKSLTGVASFLSDPSRTQLQGLERMLETRHLPSGPHPVVAQVAREMLNKEDKELSSVVSTAMSCLSLYRDPIVARNTSTSDFRISDLMNSASPVSLYLVVPPSDMDRTRPLIRLLLNQVGKRLTETLGVQGKGYRHRLLFLLDEFPSLGRLSFFETQLAFLAGYGVKCFLIAQGLNQVEKTYGANNSILDNCHVRITYGANNNATSKQVSELLGQATEVKRQLNFSGGRMAPWLGHVSEAEQEYARPLLTSGEILQLPFDEALVLVGNLPPYRAKKVMYYQDDRLRHRAGLPAPDSEAEQRAELPRRPDSVWAATAIPPALAISAAPPSSPVAAVTTSPANPAGVGAGATSPDPSDDASEALTALMGLLGSGDPRSEPSDESSELPIA